jgi:hypothetical protein
VKLPRFFPGCPTSVVIEGVLICRLEEDRIFVSGGEVRIHHLNGGAKQGFDCWFITVLEELEKCLRITVGRGVRAGLGSDENVFQELYDNHVEEETRLASSSLTGASPKLVLLRGSLQSVSSVQMLHAKRFIACLVVYQLFKDPSVRRERGVLAEGTSPT